MTSYQTPEQHDKVGRDKLKELISDIEIAMLTTRRDGILSSAPMTTQKTDFDGSLWFFIDASSAKAKDIQDDYTVNLAYSDRSAQRYVSVAGIAEVVHDEARAKELWKPIYKSWFPKGLDDPNLALLRVDIEQAEYWDIKSGLMVELIAYVKAKITGKPQRDKFTNTPQHGAVTM